MARAHELSTSKKGKLTCKTPEAFNEMFGADAEIVAPLKARSGIIFRTSPTANFIFQANYSEVVPLHSNFTYPFFQGSAFQPFTMSVNFVSSTREEAKYTLACFHFLRTMTKMTMDGGNRDFSDGALTGTPPPVLNFSIYGDQMFRNVPVVLEVYTFALEAEGKQYVDVGAIEQLANGGGEDGEGNAENVVPIDWQGSITLRPAFNPSEIRRRYSTRDFAQGRLVRDGYQ